MKKDIAEKAEKEEIKGLELSRVFYEEYGRAALMNLSEDRGVLFAVGLCGHGSECSGYDDSIAETGRLTTERRELSEQEQNELNRRFDFLISRLKGSSEVDIVHFVPDVRKPGGEYQTTTGSIKNISLPERIITLDTGVIIHLDDISYIGGSIFSEMMEDS